MRTRFRIILSWIGVAGFIIGMLLYLYFPAVPKSLLGWVVLLVLGIPVWLFIEWLGEAVFGSAFFVRLSAVGRILLAVPIMLVLMVVALVLVWGVQYLVLHA